MTRSHILMLAAAAGVAFLVYRGYTTPAPASSGTVLAPAKGDPVAAAPTQTVVGSESGYTAPSTIKLDPGGLMNQLGQLFENGQYGT